MNDTQRSPSTETVRTYSTITGYRAAIGFRHSEPMASEELAIAAWHREFYADHLALSTTEAKTIDT